MLGTLGAAGAGFGLGSLAGSLLFPGNRGVSTGSGIGGGLGAAIGSVVPGIGTFLGGAVGSLFGGAVGSLFGGKKPKRPATKEKLALNLGGYADGDMSYTLPGDWSGDATAQKVTDYYAVLAHSWNGMGQDVEDRFVSTITGAAQSAVEQAQSLQKLLPESYSEAFQKELQDRPIEFFYRYRDKDIDDDTLTEIAAEIQEETNRVMLSAFQALDFSEYAGKIDVDQSSLEGMTLPTAAYNGCRSFLEMADDAWAFHPGFWAGGMVGDIVLHTVQRKVVVESWVQVDTGSAELAELGD